MGHVNRRYVRETVRSDIFLPKFRNKQGFNNCKHFGFLIYERGTIGCPETSIRSYHFPLPDNPEQKSSPNVWVFTEGKEFETIFFKTGQTIGQLKHKH